MQTFIHEYMPVPYKQRQRGCLSCGDALPTRRHRYCSPLCRQKLLSYLNRRSGLLVALNTRYATFYFTDITIVMDVLPYGTDQIFSFILKRNPGDKPVDDYCRMAKALGSAWWNERNRTKKRYLATLCVLDYAKRVNAPLSTVIPRRVFIPDVRVSDLKALRLTKKELHREGLDRKIKEAFRRQAKIHHPDLGGNTKQFLQLHIAYEKLILWSKNPTYTRMCGFPDRWLYEGGTNRWTQPKPLKELFV